MHPVRVQDSARECGTRQRVYNLIGNRAWNRTHCTSVTRYADLAMDNLYRLINLMQLLRDPEDGCPWDNRQTFASLVPYTIDKQDFPLLREELGDLLLQIVFHAQMAREQDLFDIDDVARSISDKLVRRHPKIFEEETVPDMVTWEDIREAERRAKQGSDSLLDDVPEALPQLLRAWKIQERAATVGFDWQEARPVLAKIAEELDELGEALAAEDGQDRLAEELGDLLFSAVNLGRHLDISAEEALRKCNEKFLSRFREVERQMEQQGKRLADCSMEEMEQAWQAAKLA